MVDSSSQTPDLFSQGTNNVQQDDYHYIRMDHSAMRLLEHDPQFFEDLYQRTLTRNKGDQAKTNANIKYTILQFLKRLADLEICSHGAPCSIKELVQTLPDATMPSDTLNEIERRITEQRETLIPKYQSARPEDYLKMPIDTHLAYMKRVVQEDSDRTGNRFTDAPNLGKAIGTMQYLIALDQLVNALSSELRKPHLSTSDHVQLAVKTFKDAIAKSKNPNQLAELKTKTVPHALAALNTTSNDADIRHNMNVLRVELARGCNHIGALFIRAYDTDYKTQLDAMYKSHRNDIAHELPFCSNADVSTSEGYKARWAAAADLGLSVIDTYRDILNDASIKPAAIEYLNSRSSGQQKY